MSATHPTILVIGGGSRIAHALVPHLGDRVRWVSRRTSGRAGELCVTDYDAIPASAFDGIECAINCVGISEGGREALDHVNVALAARFASAAKAGGVRHFIHISSFSVYGGAEWIDRTTPVAPVSDYGRSKLAADNALAALDDTLFGVTLLRLPLIYAVDRPGKLGRLLRLWRRLHVMPVPAGDIARAMISVELAAEVIARLVAAPRRGIVFAADPIPFAYARTAAVRPRDGLRRVSVPRLATAIAARLAPGLGMRLFADSRLSDEDNLAIEYRLASRLYDDIAAIDPG